MNYQLPKDTPINVQKSLISIAKEKGIPVCDCFEECIIDGNLKWNFTIIIDDEGVLGIRGTRTYDYKFVTPGGVMDLILNYQPTTTVELNKNYTAIIDWSNSEIKVGCQTIPFNKVVELYDVITYKKK
jgi:hypothetical protein